MPLSVSLVCFQQISSFVVLLTSEFQIPPEFHTYASFMFSFIGRGVCMYLFLLFLTKLLIPTSLHTYRCQHQRCQLVPHFCRRDHLLCGPCLHRLGGRWKRIASREHEPRGYLCRYPRWRYCIVNKPATKELSWFAACYLPTDYKDGERSNINSFRTGTHED